ncbi:MAG TPA: alpha-amylase/4-alpha-glucanotransferase domain-containing protein [Pirellulales bacterium]|jgi:alpha-amylase|nr:alpha-amylase/4-alpha-glucanotransferase domain-containing protein [Pirellulales bacterium]
MPPPIRFLFVLHDHQPIGNFDGVFEQAYQDSYRPFLDVIEPYANFKLALHTSGSLLEWLDAHHPEYVDRLAALAAAGRLEIIGGAYFEPILPMIPSCDRVGQIRTYREFLQQRLGVTVRGAWIAERVWEQSLTSDLVAAGVEYIILDDSHFKSTGLNEDQLWGYYLTEDNGRLLRVFPGSERLRYTIPFAAPNDSIDYLRSIAEQHPGAVAVFADDGEKFGSWPDTKKPVYEEGWLRQFFDLAQANADWLHWTTPSETIDHVLPVGKVYIPEGSYREMTEWVLPPDQLAAYETARAELKQQPQWNGISRFVHGGIWKNFLVKYPEINEMYSRMMMISRRIQEAQCSTSVVPAPHLALNGRSTVSRDELLREASQELYRAQCNCPYWHGAFGGVYLPHLRNAVYQHLITAENLLDRAAGQQAPWAEAASDDWNFDDRPEVELSNDRCLALLSPSRGGQLYELDVRAICHNLLATLSRRPEAYHRRVLAGPGAAGGSVIDANQPVKFKQQGLERHLQYDNYLRKSLVDHFYDDNISLDAVAHNEAMERGDFLQGAYEARLRRNPDRVQVQLSRLGNAWGIPLKIIKGLTLHAGSSVLEIAYVIEGLPPDRELHFSVEFNFSGLPAGADDRYFYDAEHSRLGQLGTRLDLLDATNLNLVDEWLGIDIGLTFNRPTHLWTYPIETVSQSEGGFELVHQAVCVQPHWHVRPDAHGRWTTMLQLKLDTSLAEQRQAKISPPAVVAIHR